MRRGARRLYTGVCMPTFSPKYRLDTRAFNIVYAVVADSLGSESTVERMCEHMFEERSGLLISAGKRKHR